jgi:hypothetical protein
MTTNTTAAKTAKPEAAATVTTTAASIAAPATEALNTKLTQSFNGARALFGALTASGRKTAEGVLAFDKALFDLMKSGVEGQINHAKASLQAKSVNDLMSLQVAHVQSAFEATATNTREIITLAKDKAEEAYAPVKSVIADLTKTSKAA